jgi:hypothetical protein
VNKLEKLELLLRQRNFPCSIVVENYDPAVVYLRVLFVRQDKIVGVSIVDRDVDDKVDYTIGDLYALDVDCSNVDNLLHHIIDMINKNIDKIIGENV